MFVAKGRRARNATDAVDGDDYAATTTSSSPNISCSCKACSTFLRPTLSSSEPYLFSLFTRPTPATSDSTKKSLPTPSWVDKLSLAAYNVPPVIPETSAPSHKSLSVNTSSSKSASTTEDQDTRSAFPKTPGMLRCTHPDCRTRIAVVKNVDVKAPLCEEHGDVFYDAEEDVSDEASETSPRVITGTTFHPSDTVGLSAEGGMTGGGKASRKIPPEFARGTSSTASWSSLNSKDGNDPLRPGDVSSEWAASAFDSKLCW